MNPRLEELLETLHRQLTSTHSIDAPSRALLSRVLEDINRLLDEKTQDKPESSLTERLEEMEVRFETEHPALSATLRQLINTLAAAGI